MMKKKQTLIVVLAILLAGIVCFFAGREITASRYRAEGKLNAMINRSELDELADIQGKIYVTGHSTPDSDSIGSCIGYAKLLQALGYDAEPVVLSDINNETKYILEKAGVEAPRLLEDASGCTMILVDHSEYTQSAEGLQDANIISIMITTGSVQSQPAICLSMMPDRSARQPQSSGSGTTITVSFPINRQLSLCWDRSCQTQLILNLTQQPSPTSRL